MKKLFSLLFFWVFLVSCTQNDTANNTDTQHVSTGIFSQSIDMSEVSHAKGLVEKLAQNFAQNTSEIIQTKHEFSEFFEAKKITAYQLKSGPIKYKDLEAINMREFLEGWVEGNHVDGPDGYYVEYTNDSYVCAARADLINDDVYDSITEDMEEEIIQDILESREYYYYFTCAEKPDNLVSMSDLHFSAFGGGDSGLWNMFISEHIIDLSFSELEGDIRFFVKRAQKTENGYKIEASYQSDISLEIEKKSCQVYENAETFPYTINFKYGDNSYTACGDELNALYRTGRYGKISSFLEQTGLEYTGTVPTDGEYSIYTKKDLVQIMFADKNNYENVHYIILRNGLYDDTVYWNGGDTVDLDTCEQFADDEELMDFSIFYSCPKG